jgi:hypothetical protein
MEDCLYPAANSCSASHSIPCPLQNTLVHYHFQHILTHTPSPIFLAHLCSLLTYILHWTTSLLGPICLVHFKRHAVTPKWGTKKVIHCKIMGPFPNQVYSPSSMLQTNCHTYSYQNTTLTNKHVYISIVMLSESRKQSKTLRSCSEHYSKIFSSHFLDSAIFIP